MTAYRRSSVPGGTYFFTVNLADRRRALLTENIESLRAAFRYARHQHPFTIDAIVVLPDHLHTIWTMPDCDSDFGVRWTLIKGGFSRRLPGGEPVSDSRLRRRERGIWQRRYWKHAIREARTGLGTLSTFISIRSSTAMRSTRAPGLIRRSIEWCGSGFTPRIGRGTRRPQRVLSGNAGRQPSPRCRIRKMG